MKTITSHFFEFAPTREESSIPETLVRHLDLFSSIATESFYMVDVQQQRFCYIQPHTSFLCDYAAEEALNLGYDFYPKIVHPDDLPTWKKMHKAILRYLDDDAEKRDEVDYFSCTFRLQHKYSFLSHPLPQMVYHRLKPVWVDDQLRYLICSVAGTSTKEALRMYNSDGKSYEEYNLQTHKWKPITIKPLTEHERVILMLEQQGKNVKEISSFQILK